MTTTDTVQQNTDRAAALAAGLRELANMIEKNPALLDISAIRYVFDRALVSVDTREDVSALARAGARSGAKVTKHVGSKYAGVDIAFGSASLHVYADRDEVCERIVIGTREVTEEVPDPEALAAVPKVAVTKIVEDVEWRCSSFLAPEPSADELPAAVSA